MLRVSTRAYLAGPVDGIAGALEEPGEAAVPDRIPSEAASTY